MALSKITTESLLDGEITLAKFANLGSDGQVMTSTGGSSPPAFESTTTNVATVEATYNMTTASGNQDITGFGFNPTHFIIVAGIDNTITSSIGMGDFTNEGCNASRDGSTTMNMQLTLVADVETGAGAAQRANGSSSISDGIRLAWGKSGSPSGTMNIVITGFIK